MVTSQPGRLWRHAQWVAGSCLWLAKSTPKSNMAPKMMEEYGRTFLGMVSQCKFENLASCGREVNFYSRSWQLVFLYPGIPLYVKYPGSSVLLTSHVRPASPHLKLPLEECSLQEIMRTMKMMVGAWESLPCRRHGHGFQWMKRRQSFQALATYDNLQAFWLVI